MANLERCAARHHLAPWPCVEVLPLSLIVGDSTRPSEHSPASPPPSRVKDGESWVTDGGKSQVASLIQLNMTWSAGEGAERRRNEAALPLAPPPALTRVARAFLKSASAAT